MACGVVMGTGYQMYNRTSTHLHRGEVQGRGPRIAGKVRVVAVIPEGHKGGESVDLSEAAFVKRSCHFYNTQSAHVDFARMLAPAEVRATEPSATPVQEA